MKTRTMERLSAVGIVMAFVALGALFLGATYQTLCYFSPGRAALVVQQGGEVTLEGTGGIAFDGAVDGDVTDTEGAREYASYCYQVSVDNNTYYVPLYNTFTLRSGL